MTKNYYCIFSFQDGDAKIIEELKTALQSPSKWNKLAKKILEEEKISKEILKQFAESIVDVQLSVKFDGNKNSFYVRSKCTKFNKDSKKQKKKKR